MTPAPETQPDGAEQRQDLSYLPPAIAAAVPGVLFRMGGDRVGLVQIDFSNERHATGQDQWRVVDVFKNDVRVGEIRFTKEQEPQMKVFPYHAVIGQLREEAGERAVQASATE